MQGFKEFLMRGNLIELAVAFIMATAFGALVTAFTDLVIDLIGMIFTIPDFSTASVAGIKIGPFVSAAVNFVLIAAVVYFGIVKPYDAYKKAIGKADDAEEEEELKVLGEIRDLLAGR